MKKVLSLCLVLTLCLGCISLFGCARKNNTQGSVIIQLRPDQAPKTVENFLKLVDSQFYDGLTMHRIIPDFMIQGGDPKGDGSGSSADKIEGEFISNGHLNTLYHKRGVVSMARASDMNSASCQFFICHTDENVEHLDGDYAAFGIVVSGMEVVDAIATGEYKFADNNGLVVDGQKPEIISIRRTSFNGDTTHPYVEIIFNYYVK